MNFFKSPRHKNQSKRFPTRELEHEDEKGSREIRPKPTPREEFHIALPNRSPNLTVNTTTTGAAKNARSVRPLRTKDSSTSTGITVRNTSGLEDEKSIEDKSFKQDTTDQAQPSTSDSDFDLRPPPTKSPATSLETLSELLYSQEYFETLTSDSILLGRFSVFLNKYRPDIAPLIQQYLETQKIVKATQYANAVASTLDASSDGRQASPAVELTESFLVSSRRAFNILLQEALPAWVTYSLVKTATSCLKAEIMNQSTALTRDLFGGLSEVFCISDPNQPDNPLVYASEEFYRLTGYGRDNVLGHNCRFLQGPKTRRESTRRLRVAIDRGEELCETILNYRRDGSPFINVLLLAPLFDSKGRLKYFLGAQVDASRLVEDGRGVDGFDKYLRRKDFESKQVAIKTQDPKEDVLAKLRELGKTFDLEESAVVEDIRRSSTLDSEAYQDLDARPPSSTMGRNVIQEDDDLSSSDIDEKEDPTGHDDKAWLLSSSMTSGRLPGIYQKYVLMRPYPSLKMVFVSHRAKRLGQLTQQPFLAHIAAPAATISGLRASLESGRPVTAKVAILSRRGESRDGTITGRWSKRGNRPEGEIDPAKIGRTCWIAATPLLDSDRKTGVWMVVIVDKVATNTSIPGSLGQTPEALEGGHRSIASDATRKSVHSGNGDFPIKPVRVGQSSSPDTPNTDLHSANIIQNVKDRASGLHEEIKDSPKDEEENVELAEAVVQKIERPQKVSTIDTKYGEGEQSPTGMVNSFQDVTEGGLESESKTPSRARHSNEARTASNTPAPRNMDSNRDVGLRAMDYLSSRSPINKKNQKGETGAQDLGDSTPNSVD